MSTVPGLAVQSVGDRVDLMVDELQRLLQQLGMAEAFPGRRRVIWYLESAVVQLENSRRGLRSAEQLLASREVA